MLLLFYKDHFDVELPMKGDMILKNQTKPYLNLIFQKCKSASDSFIQVYFLYFLINKK